MQKLIFALVALVAVALADGSVSPHVECSMYYRTEISSETPDGIVTMVVDTEMMHKNGMVFIYQNSTDAEIKGLVRCDINNGDHCYVQTLNTTSGECEEEFSDYQDPTVDDIFYYDGDKTQVDCPYEGITNCFEYCNTTENLCIILDSNENLVQLRGENFNYTNHFFSEGARLEDFAGKKCDGTTDIPAPRDICTESSSAAPSSAAPSSSAAPAPKYVEPKFDCETSMTVTLDSTQTGTLVSIVSDVKMMHTKDMFYAWESFENTTVVIRCDIKEDDKCLVITNVTGDDPQCGITWADWSTNDMGEPIYYDQGPNDVDCPYDGIKDCKEYCNSTDKACAVLDSEGYQVFMHSFDYVINQTFVYHKDDVKLEDFVAYLCNETQTDVPAAICPAPGPSQHSAGSFVTAAFAVVAAAIVVALF